MPELPNYITPDQLKEIGQTIATAIAAAKDLPELTLTELNSENITATALQTLRKVKHTSGSIVLGYVLTFKFMAAVCQLYIGMTSSEGDTEALAAPNVNSYGKQPGCSIAIRYNVVINTFDKDIVTSTGLTPWHVTQIADYNGLLALGDGSSSGCNCNFWIGTQEDYASVSDVDPKTVNFILE